MTNSTQFDRDDLHTAYCEAASRLGLDVFAFAAGDETFRQVGEREFELDLDDGGLVTLGFVQETPVLLIQQDDAVHAAIARSEHLPA